MNIESIENRLKNRTVTLPGQHPYAKECPYKTVLVGLDPKEIAFINIPEDVFGEFMDCNSERVIDALSDYKQKILVAPLPISVGNGLFAQDPLKLVRKLPHSPHNLLYYHTTLEEGVVTFTIYGPDVRTYFYRIGIKSENLT